MGERDGHGIHHGRRVGVDVCADGAASVQDPIAQGCIGYGVDGLVEDIDPQPWVDEDQVVSGIDPAVDGAASDARALRDVVDRRIEASSLQLAGGCFTQCQQRLTPVFGSGDHNDSVVKLARCDTYRLTMQLAQCDTSCMDALVLSQPFENPDYADRFVLETTHEGFVDVDDFIRDLALHQPSWLTGISMGIRDGDKVRAAVGDGPLDAGDAIGNWEVVERSGDSVTFAEDMGIMAYRISYRWETERRVVAETEVVQRSRLLGRIYWGLATPMHKRFLTRMLRNAAGVDGSTVIEDTSL